MGTIKERLSNVTLCLFEAVIGILLLINPIGFTSGIIIACGVVLLLTGIISTVKYFRTDPEEAASSQMLLKGLLCLLFGAFCTFQSHWFVVIFPVLTILYGVAILAVGLGKMQWTVDMMRLKKGKWQMSALSAAVSLICAVLILLRPFTTTTLLWMFTGASLVVEAVIDLLVLITNKKKEV